MCEVISINLREAVMVMLVVILISVGGPPGFWERWLNPDLDMAMWIYVLNIAFTTEIDQDTSGAAIMFMQFSAFKAVTRFENSRRTLPSLQWHCALLSWSCAGPKLTQCQPLQVLQATPTIIGEKQFYTRWDKFECQSLHQFLTNCGIFRVHIRILHSWIHINYVQNVEKNGGRRYETQMIYETRRSKLNWCWPSVIVQGLYLPPGFIPHQNRQQSQHD